ncbi:MAG: hypothetical protein SF162_16000 [bacterium]|nr:hypothetical protein [bacterium]
MPEISLREYLAKLDTALFAGSADEVIQHCRHILQFYPKNVAAYRYLGRALVYNARHDEGSAALRRVLGVIPDDSAAHVRLSEAYDSLKKGNEAIWHLERAFEQDPANRELIDGLRTLYRRYRNLEPKIQLTSAAIARQHLASGRYDQAIETLRGAVARTPDRVDLKLLLAQTLWRHGDQVAGAEVALDVLEILPDCLEANAILTELWLDEDRPSDAQRYLNRVEAVDPYRALELAGADAPDDAFRLEELDYQRFAKTEVSSARPDWLSTIGSDPAAAAAAAEDPNAEWTRWTSGMLPTPPEDAAASVQAIESPTDPLPPRVQPQREPSSGSQRDEVPDFTLFDDFEPNDAPEQPLELQEDPLAWMREAGVEIQKPQTSPDLFDEDFSVNIETENPLAWLDVDDQDDVPINAPAVPQDQADPLAWLQAEQPDDSADDDFNFDAPAQPTAADALPDWMRSAAPVEPSPDARAAAALPDWMQPEAMPDLFADEPLAAPPSAVAAPMPDFSLFDAPADVNAASSDNTSFDSALDVPSISEIAPAGGDNVPGPRKGLTSLLNNANLDWLAKDQPETPPAPADDPWMAMFSEPSQPQAVTDAPDWLNALDDSPPTEPITDSPADFSGMEFDMPSEDDFNWLTGETDEQDPLKPSPISDTHDSGALNFDFAAPAAEQPIPSGDAPDWLYALRPEQASAGDPYSPQDAASQETSFQDTPGEFEGEPLSNDLPDWLMEMQPAEDANSQPTPETQQPAAAEGEFDWASVEPEAEAEAQDALDWLADVSSAPAERQPDFDAVTHDTLIAADPVPDWLSAVAPEPESPGAGEPAPAQPAEESFDLAFDTLDDAEIEPMPDWLSEMKATGEFVVASDAAAEPPAASDPVELTFDAVSDVALPDAGASTALPDWLSSLTDAGETPESAEVYSSDFISADVTAEPTTPDSNIALTEALIPVGMGAVEEEPAPLDAVPAQSDEDELGWLTEAGESLPYQDNVAHDFGVLEGVEDDLFATNSEWATDDLAASVGAQNSVTDFDAEPEPDTEPDSALAAADLSFLASYDDPLAEAEPEGTDLTAMPSWLTDMQADEADDLLADAPVTESDPALPAADLAITEALMPVGMGAMEAEPAPLGDVSPTSDVSPAGDDEFEWMTEAGESLPYQADVAHDLGVLEGEADALFATNSEWATDDLAASVGAQNSVTDFDAQPQPEAEPMDNELTPETVGNVPDWLNAIIPGIDIDVESDEYDSSLVESAFVEEDRVLEPDTSPLVLGSSDFQWLNDIVDEETYEAPPEAPPALPETPSAVAPAAAPAASGQGRFAFTRRPEWLKFSKAPAWLKQSDANAQPKANAPQNAGDDFPDWPEDDPNGKNELPSWMK